MKTSLLCFALGCLCCATLPAAGKVVPLFNGKDLSGWTFDVENEPDPKEIWSVQDGVLICKGKPAGVIRTKEFYDNYELTLEWRWAPGTKGGNSGLLLHSSEPRQMGIWPKSLEVQLMSGNAGDFWQIHETIDVPADRKPDEGRRIPNLTDGSEKPVGEWNTMKVVSKDGSLTVWVNGEKVNEGTNCSAKKGAICLQSEGAEIHFRKVELKPVR